MHLENVVFDAAEPRRLGRFWEGVVGATPLTDEPEGYETRLSFGDAFLDLCFPHVADPDPAPPRLVPVVARQAADVLALGARRSDTPDGYLDPAGNPLRLADDPSSYDEDGPLAALVLDCADVEREAVFWSWLTGWASEPDRPHDLRHPSRRGPVLQLRPERAPKSSKSRLHLDVRLDPGDDVEAVAAGIRERGGADLVTDWGELPWRTFTDPSGNELCVLGAS